MGFARKAFVFVLLLALVAVVLYACGKGGGTPGQKLDRALDKAGEKIQDAGESLKSR